MATVAPSALYGIYKLIDPHLKSMRIGGVVGDTRHVAGGGYHISRDDLKSHGQGGDYSIQAPADKRGPGNAAAAADITLSTSEMVTVSKRLKAAFDKDEDRIDVLREFIGTVDNKNVCGWNRYQTGRRTGWYSSGYSESSHLWHVHLSFFRDYVDDVNSIRGVAEVVCGLKPGALGWKNTNGATAPSTQEDELPSADDLVKALTNSKPFLDAMAKRMLDLDYVPNAGALTSNVDNENVATKTALSQLGKKSNSIEAKVDALTALVAAQFPGKPAA